MSLYFNFLYFVVRECLPEYTHLCLINILIKSYELLTMTHCSMHNLSILFWKKSLELCVSGIYPRIFIRIVSLFMAGEGTLGFETKAPACTRFVARYAMLRPLRGKRRRAASRQEFFKWFWLENWWRQISNFQDFKNSPLFLQPIF